MSVELKLDAAVRDDQGKGASRRLRRAKRVPGILYGADKKPVSLSFDEEQILRLLREEAFFSQILDVKVKGKRTEKAILKDLQRHPFKPLVTHLDLLRVKAGEKMRQQVPIHLLHQDEAVGVKQGNGVVHHDLIEIDVECLPDDLPTAIELDIIELNVGDSIHLSQVEAPAGVSFPGLDVENDHDPILVSIHTPRKAVEEGDEDEGADEGTDGGESDDTES